MKFIKFYLLKDKIDYNKIMMPTQNNLIIVIGSAKQSEVQIIIIIIIYHYTITWIASPPETIDSK
jgi:hypothetical protein